MGPPQDGDDRESMFLPGMEDLAPPEGGPADERRANENAGTTISPMSTDANPVVTNAGAPHPPAGAVPTNGQVHERANAEVHPAPTRDYVEPLWMKRSKLVMFVMACIYLGIILIILPWNDVWTQNGLIHRYPALREMAMNNFVRGAITGLGFVNVWLGVWEAVHYREKK